MVVIAGHRLTTEGREFGIRHSRGSSRHAAAGDDGEGVAVLVRELDLDVRIPGGRRAFQRLLRDLLRDKLMLQWSPSVCSPVFRSSLPDKWGFRAPIGAVGRWSGLPVTGKPTQCYHDRWIVKRCAQKCFYSMCLLCLFER